MKAADIILMMLLVAALTGLYLHFWTAPAAAQWVEIRSGKDAASRHSLWEPAEIRVAGRLGDSVIQIQAGRARFTDSPCRNRICIHSGWHEHNGEAAACAPNGVSIELVGGSEAIDAIAF